MSDYVRSVRELSAEIRDLLPADTGISSEHYEPQRPIAIVGIHGVSPIQQYAFQDQLATGLLAYLNAVEERRLGSERRSAVTSAAPEVERRSGDERRVGHDRRWIATPYWPRVSKPAEDPALKPSALRLHHCDERDPSLPLGQVYDVYEGYWSPFSKGKTNVASLCRWLLSCTFLATSSTARVPATWAKLFWDFGYVFAALFAALLCFAVAFVTATAELPRYVGLFQGPIPSFWSVLGKPLDPFVKFPDQLKTLPWHGAVHLILNVVLAYLVIQLIVLLRVRSEANRRKTELLNDSGEGGHFRAQTIGAEQFHRAAGYVFGTAVVAVVIADAILLSLHPEVDRREVALNGALLLLAVGLVQLGRGIADFVVENILGDVQIYTTHDSNSSFYAIRQQIITAVTNAMIGPLSSVFLPPPGVVYEPHALNTDGKPGRLSTKYERVHVMGHSLGSTIAVDVLLRLRQLAYEGAIEEDSWALVRSLTTFGTALEKTRFLTDVRNPTVSAAQQQWQNDAYGRFFTLDEATLKNVDNHDGIYWSNHWYWRDVVANKIVSYKSVVKPGTGSFTWHLASAQEHDICFDDEIPHPRWFGAFVHGDYMGDAQFWAKVGPVLTRRN